MALRGETIGRAYVKILADGTGFGDSIRDELRDEDGAFQQLGRRHSEAYDEGFNEQIDDISKRLVAGLEAGAKRNRGRFDAIGDQIAGDLFDPIDKQFRIAFGDLVGNQMSKDMREAFFRSGGASDVLDEFVENWEANWEKASDTVDKQTKQIAKMVKAQEERLTQIEAEEAEERKSIREENFRDAINRIKKEVEIRNEAAASNKKQMADERRTLRDTRIEWTELVRQIKAYHQGIDQTGSSRKQLNADLDRIVTKMRNAGGATKTFERDVKSMRTELVRTHPFLSRSARLFDDFGDTIGRAFGKGARNDFFNLFGRIIGFFTSLPGLIPKALSAVSNFFGSFKVAFQGGLGQGFGKIAVTVGTLTAALGALGVVMGVVAVVAGVLSSALLSLLGALTAVVGSLTFALGGAVAIAVAALAPLGAAIGIAVLAFKNAPKEVSKSIGEIQKIFKGFGKTAADNIFGTDEELEGKTTAFKDALKGLEPIIDNVSKAMGGLLDEFIASLQSPQFKGFTNTLNTVLPGMVTSLGHIFGNLGTAFIGFFTGVAPFLTEFLDWLETVTGDFSDWINSVQGQNAVRDFMERAKDSAIAVGDALGNAIELLGDLLSVGKDSGDNIFESISNTLQDWIDKLQTAKEDGTIQKWFEDARQVATELGSALVSLSEFIAKLDTPKNRELVKDLAKAFEGLLTVLQIIAPILEAMATGVAAWAKPFVDAVKTAKNAWQNFGELFRTVYNAAIGPVISGLLTALGSILESLGDLFSALDIKGAPAWIGETADNLHGAATKANELAGQIRNIPEEHTTTFNAVANQATINKVEGQLGYLARTRYAAIVVTHVEGPRPGAGSDPGSGDGQSSGRVVASGSGRVVNVNMTVNTPTTDVAGVAQETINRIAAAAYI